MSWAILGGLGWLLFAWGVRWVLAPGFRDADLAACACVRFNQVYCRLVHRVRVEGLEHVPARSPGGAGARPLLVIANHTAGVDPMLIQSALPFEVRWVMAQDMRLASLDWLWRFGRVIFVDRENGDGQGLREAIRHLKSGGTLGLFPEGGIERPAGKLLPFQPGVGLLIARTKPIVLPALIEGTPQVDPAWASLWRASRSRVRFLSVIDFEAERVKAGEIADRLRAMFAAASGWEANDHPPRFEQGRWWYVDASGTYTPADEVEVRGMKAAPRGGEGSHAGADHRHS